MSAITIDNDLVHYEVLGRGRPVILLHGWLSSWRYWIPSMQQLSMKYRTYALDLWGYGDSGKDPNRLTLDAHVELLGNFMDKLGIPKAAFVGHSLGAAVMIRYARENPDRVARLMAISPPVFEFEKMVIIPTAVPDEAVEKAVEAAASSPSTPQESTTDADAPIKIVEPDVASASEPAGEAAGLDEQGVDIVETGIEAAWEPDEPAIDDEDSDEFFPRIELDELVALLTVGDDPFFPTGPEEVTETAEVSPPDSLPAEPALPEIAEPDETVEVLALEEAAKSDPLPLEAADAQAEPELAESANEGTEAAVPASVEPTESGTRVVSVLHERLMTASPQVLLSRHVSKDVPEYDRLFSEVAKTAPSAFESSVRSFDGIDFAESIRQMSSPTLLVHGENDAFMPLPSADTIETMARDREGFRCVVWPEMNHFPMLDDPTSFHRLVMDFLEARNLNDLEFKERWVRKVR